MRKIVSDREKVSLSLWPNAPQNALGSCCLAAAVIVDVKVDGNIGGGGVHVGLSARRLLALLEECNPDASNNDRATYSHRVAERVRAEIVGLALFKTILLRGNAAQIWLGEATQAQR